MINVPYSSGLKELIKKLLQINPKSRPMIYDILKH